MAWLELEPSGRYHVAFRSEDRKPKKSLANRSRGQAEIRLARLEETIQLVECGRLEISSEVDVATLLLSDGKPVAEDAIDRTGVAPLTDDFSPAAYLVARQLRQAGGR
jgi:hypothetical protein